MIKLSIIICTYNRAKELNRCLLSLYLQLFDKRNYEVICVDNNSTNDTKKIVLHYSRLNPEIKYVREENIGLSFARNKGFAEAKYSYLVFLDDDVILPSNYLSNVQEVITTWEPDILGGPVLPYYLYKKPWWFRDRYVERKYEKKSGFSRKCSITGANYIIKKSVMKTLGLFDVNFGMKGKNIGIGEERKLLDTYRKNVPLKKQRVYYSLKSYVWHTISRTKMRFIYQIKRSLISGIMWTRLRKELDLKVLSSYESIFLKKSSILFLVYAIYILFKELYISIKSGKLIENFVDIIFDYVFKMGILLETRKLKK